MVRDYHRSAAENVGIGADAGDAAVTGSAFHAVAPVSALCAAFAAQPSTYPPEAPKPDVTPVYRRTGNSTEAQRSGFGRKRKCGGMDETCRLQQMREHAETGKIGGFWAPRRESGEKAARKQPAMDLSRDKNAEEMKWSPLEMGAAMQAHGA